MVSSLSSCDTPVVRQGAACPYTMRMSLYGTYADLSKLSTITEEEHVEFSEIEEENFVITSLLNAAEEGNIQVIQELTDNSSLFDINIANRHGETALHMAASAGHVDVIQLLQKKGMDMTVQDVNGDQVVYWAARQGHISVISYLKDNCGLSLNSQNKAGESAIHVAVRYNHVDVVKYLCDNGADVSIQDKHGDTALHIAAWHGSPYSVYDMLCAAGCKVDSKNKDDEVPLHCAAARNNSECVKVLLANGADTNITDKRGSTPLHFATRRKHIPTAVLLLNAGCQLDIVDVNGETPLHLASRDGVIEIVRGMCVYGCRVDIINKSGLTSLHLAAKAGYVEVVRCLLLSGAAVDVKNKDGISAEVMALANGQQEVAELLYRLRPDRHENYIRQLTPTAAPLNRIKVKLLGSSGVGKTTLIESLKCGYFGSLLRRAGLGSGVMYPSSPVKCVQENGFSKHRMLETRLCYEPIHSGYTHGIDIQQVSISGAGDVSIWEFSGYQPYHVIYDEFIGDVNCIHIIVISLAESRHVQLTQLVYWLNFILARVTPMNPIGRDGRSIRPARVLLVATHADCVLLGDDSPDVTATVLLESVRHKFHLSLDLYSRAFAVNALEAMSPEIKNLRGVVAELKSNICQFLPRSNGFLEATVAALPAWRRALPSYPVVTWPCFIEYIRATVNSLASDDHIRELICQLQHSGEVLYIEVRDGAHEDLVVLTPHWLGMEVFGRLLAYETTSRCRPTGCFTVDDFQPLMPESSAEDILTLLCALQLCTRCDLGDETPEHEIEHEIPCLNFVETLAGLWDDDQLNVGRLTYGGIRFETSRLDSDHLMYIFPRLQVKLRHRFLLAVQSDPDCDLYQWFHGSKYCSGSGAETLITLEKDEQAIEIKCRGLSDSEFIVNELYRLYSDMSRIISEGIRECLPGLYILVSYLSPYDLAGHDPNPYAYSSRDILNAIIDRRTTVPRNQGSQGIEEESVASLVAFGSEEVFQTLHPGTDLHVSKLPLETRRRLSVLLDPADPTGRDWCLLAVTLGLTSELPTVEGKPDALGSPSERVLARWSVNDDSAVSSLITALDTLGRTDAVDALLNTLPAFYDRTIAGKSANVVPPNHL